MLFNCDTLYCFLSYYTMFNVCEVRVMFCAKQINIFLLLLLLLPLLLLNTLYSRGGIFMLLWSRTVHVRWLFTLWLSLKKVLSLTSLCFSFTCKSLNSQCFHSFSTSAVGCTRLSLSCQYYNYLRSPPPHWSAHSLAGFGKAVNVNCMQTTLLIFTY